MSLNILDYLNLGFTYGPIVQQILAEAQSNDDAMTKIQKLAAPVAGVLEQLGAQFFPQAASTLHTVAGAIKAFNPDKTKWLQGALNNLLDPSPGLVVDGQYGEKTKAAVMLMQTKLGLKIDGVAGKITNAAIDALLNPPRPG